MSIAGSQGIALKAINIKMTPDFVENAQCRIGKDGALNMTLDLSRLEVTLNGNVVQQFVDDHSTNPFQHKHRRRYRFKELEKSQSGDKAISREYESLFQSFMEHSFCNIIIPNALFFY